VRLRPGKTPRPVTGRACYRCARELSRAERVFCGGCGSPIPVLIGAHSGAGVSALAGATGFVDQDESAHAAAHPRAVRLLVARTHHAGLDAARRSLGTSRDGGGYTRLLLVPDAPGALPKPLADQVAILGGATAITRMPWVEAWRWAPASTTETFARFLPTLTTQLITDVL
jgi:hypothetical protein